jgi:hypothetical protein
MSRREHDAELEDARARAIAELEVLHAGREIDAPEYERKVALAKRARSTPELDALDVPESTPAVGSSAELAHPADERGSVVAILTGARRTGAWEPPGNLSVLNVLGGVRLDFREAELLEGVTEVVVTAILGGVEIIAPPGANVQSDGLALMGEFTHLAHRSPHPQSPLLRIRGFSLMGGVKVKIKS